MELEACAKSEPSTEEAIGANQLGRSIVPVVRRATWIVLLGICWSPPPACSQAAPANPGIRRVEQPDRSSFYVRMRGDEHQGWMETVDGYTVIKNKNHCNGNRCWFEYAVRGRDGGLAPSGVVVTAGGNLKQFPAGRLPPKGLRPLPNAVP
jgi:hypothetical protein